MSRGLGKVERAILATLEEQRQRGIPPSLNLKMLTEHLCEISLVNKLLGQWLKDTPGYSAIKRATRSLARKGLLKRHSTAKQCVVQLVSGPPEGDHLAEDVLEVAR